ncbi:guanylate kinase [Brachyspira pilosicoli]|uniref:guanylate kinase n=1 Tax=Brachyspira pilosicoli TaxID=52584 RepID=UPI0030059C47
MSNIVVITAPSAAGKTTLIKKYMSKHSNAMFSVSHTTRNIREGEVDGKDYYFIDKDTFQKMIDNGDFIEWANVHDNYYGTSFKELEKANDEKVILILDIDIQGALFLKEKGIHANYIFIEPPSIDDLKARLEARGTESEESMKIRIQNAKRELEYKNKFDIIIKNDEIDVAYKQLEEAINSKL